MGEYIVSLNVSFSTPIDVYAKTDKEAEKKAKNKFNKLFNDFKRNLNDLGDYVVDIDYVENQDS